MSKCDIFMFNAFYKSRPNDKTLRRDISINMKVSIFQLFNLEIKYSTKVQGYTSIHRNSNASFRLHVFIIIFVSI